MRRWWEWNEHFDESKSRGGMLYCILNRVQIPPHSSSYSCPFSPSMALIMIHNWANCAEEHEMYLPQFEIPNHLQIVAKRTFQQGSVNVCTWLFTVNKSLESSPYSSGVFGVRTEKYFVRIRHLAYLRWFFTIHSLRLVLISKSQTPSTLSVCHHRA